jgi:endonuclease/exonuclease/phosphatase (EEP) superfamily protein YafD
VRQRTKRWLWWTVRGVVGVLVLGLAVVTFLPEIATNRWWIRLLAFPRVQILIALIVLLVASRALPDRFRWPGLATFVLAASALGFQTSVIFPWTPLAGTQVRPAKACPSGDTLRVMEANVQMTDKQTQKFLDEVRSADPDVLLVQEVDRWWHEHLDALYDRYPYHVNRVAPNYYGIALLSKYPLGDDRIVFMADARDPAVVADIGLPGKPTIEFYGVHPRPPTVGQSSAERDAMLMDTALRMAKRQPAAQIVAGDFNATPWSAIVCRLARIAHLLDPRIGRGWYPTWKANAVVLRWPLDNVLFTKDFTLLDFRALAPFGSDHQPTLTTLCHAPSATAAQPAPEPAPEDIALAKRAVVRGQNKAVPSPEPKLGEQEPHED